MKPEPQHCVTLCEAMWCSRQNSNYCDLIIFTTTSTLYAHSVVLANASPELHLLITNFSDTSQRGIKHKLDLRTVGCDHKHMLNLLSFCYIGILGTISDTSIQSLYTVAQYLGLKQVGMMCLKYMKLADNAASTGGGNTSEINTPTEGETKLTPIVHADDIKIESDLEMLCSQSDIVDSIDEYTDSTFQFEKRTAGHETETFSEPIDVHPKREIASVPVHVFRNSKRSHQRSSNFPSGQQDHSFSNTSMNNYDNYTGSINTEILNASYSEEAETFGENTDDTSAHIPLKVIKTCETHITPGVSHTSPRRGRSSRNQLSEPALKDVPSKRKVASRKKSNTSEESDHILDMSDSEERAQDEEEGEDREEMEMDEEGGGTDEEDEQALNTTNSRFKQTTDQYLSNMTQRRFSKSTDKKVTWALKMYEEWVKFHNKANSPPIVQPLEEMDRRTLDSTLSRFLCEIKKKDGSEYPGNTLYEIIAMLQVYFHRKGIPIKLNDDPSLRVRFTLDNLMKERARLGIGLNKKVGKIITLEEEEIMWEKGILGDQNPQVLLNTMLYLNGRYFEIRSAKEQHKLRHENSQLSVVFDECYGLEFLEYRQDTAKTQGLKHKKIRPKTVRVYANTENPTRCIVRLYKQYNSLCPKIGRKAFYLRPRIKVEDDCWFSTMIVGENSIRPTVPDMCREAGLEGYRTNHSFLKVPQQVIETETEVLIIVREHANETLPTLAV